MARNTSGHPLQAGRHRGTRRRGGRGPGLDSSSTKRRRSFMMMVLSALRPDASLPEFLAYRARSASIRRLSIDLAVGLTGLAAALRWRPGGWMVVASLALMFLAYGG